MTSVVRQTSVFTSTKRTRIVESELQRKRATRLEKKEKRLGNKKSSSKVRGGMSESEGTWKAV